MKYLAGALIVGSTYNYSHVALVAYKGSDSKLFALQSGFNYGRKMLYGTGPYTNLGREQCLT